MPKDIVWLCHSDEESGTTIFDDGTRVYWTGGFSEAVVVKPDGSKFKIDITTTPNQYVDISGNGPSEGAAYRMMTEREEAEWWEMRE